VPEAFDAGYGMASDTHQLWQTFEAAHHKASLPGNLDHALRLSIRPKAGII
jgi:hypothetical protein